MNTVLLYFNILLAVFGFGAWLSPKFKFWAGYHLQVSAKADWKRAEYKQELAGQYVEPVNG